MGKGKIFLAEENLIHNSMLSLEGFVVNQCYKEIAAFRFGKYGMDYNGCEIISEYNVLLMFGEKPDLSDIVYFYESRFAFLKGKIGLMPFQIGKYLTTRGYTLKKYKRNFDSVEQGVYIINVWNRKYTNGIHTMAVYRDALGQIGVFNGYGTEYYPSFRNFISQEGIHPIQLLQITGGKNGF